MTHGFECLSVLAGCSVYLAINNEKQTEHALKNVVVDFWALWQYHLKIAKSKQKSQWWAGEGLVEPLVKFVLLPITVRGRARLFIFAYIT